MSGGKIREDKTCQNCGTTVEHRFCPNCGQENTETRKSFHYLFTHFLEDLVHYDSGFWKTMKYLLFYPAKLTKEYLSGKRQSHVVPVKLYIFISFITFFITGFMLTPKSNDKESFKVTESKGKGNVSVFYNNDKEKKAKEFEDKTGWFGDYKTVRELDSVQNASPESKKMAPLQYWFNRKFTAIAEHNTQKQALEKFQQLFKQNIPKGLFLYMPLFAFSLWLFHGKKRWYYFDHGIFTLHYFSFLLLSTGLFLTLDSLLGLSDFFIFTILQVLLTIAFSVWPILYFYKAHKRFYEESKFISFIKSTMLFFVNAFLLAIVMGLIVFYTAISIH